MSALLRHFLLTALLGSLCLLAGQVLAGEMVAHESVQLDAAEVREVYLGEKQFAGKLRLVPVDNLAAQERFLSTVLQSDERQYAARWTRNAFRHGIAPPPLKGSDAEVLAFVRSTPGAVGYITTHTDMVGVRVLFGF